MTDSSLAQVTTECWKLHFEQLDRIETKLDRLLADRHVSTLGPTALEDRFREAEKAMAGEEEEGR